MIFLLLPTLLFGEFYLFPDDTEEFFHKFRKDFKSSSQIFVVSDKIFHKRFFHTFRKALNRNSRMLFVVSSLDGDIPKLATYGTSYIFQLPKYRDEDTDLSGVLIDSKILYLFSTRLSSEEFKDGFGFGIRIQDRNSITKFEKSFETLLKRSTRKYK